MFLMFCNVSFYVFLRFLDLNEHSAHVNSYNFVVVATMCCRLFPLSVITPCDSGLRHRRFGGLGSWDADRCQVGC